MLEREIGAEDRVCVFNKEVCVLVISEQSHVAEDSESAQELSLNLLGRIHPAERDTDHVVGKNTSHKEREEVGGSLRVEVERSDDQPELRKGEPFEVIEHVINDNYCRKEQKYKFIGCENHDKPFLIYISYLLWRYVGNFSTKILSKRNIPVFFIRCAGICLA